MIAYGSDEHHGVFVIGAGLDNLTENRHQDFAGDSEDRCALDVSKSESGDLRRGPRSGFTVRNKSLQYGVRIAELSTGAVGDWLTWDIRKDTAGLVAMVVVRESVRCFRGPSVRWAGLRRRWLLRITVLSSPLGRSQGDPLDPDQPNEVKA